MQRWQALLTQLEVIDKSRQTKPTEADLLAFEAQTGIALPAGYKEFRQVFGSGTFGDFVNIYGGCPNVKLSEELIGFLRQSLERVAEWYRSLNIEPLESLLNSAFVFGGTSRAESFLWDLRTYNETDQSYDIYLARIDDSHVYLVGRDFYEFVRDFCLGMKAFEVLPEGLRPDPQEIYPTFNR